MLVSQFILRAPQYIKPLLYPLPDLSHVDLPPRNLDGVLSPTNHPMNWPPHQSQSISAGAAIPPIPPGLVEKIESGAYVEMGDLIPSRLGLEETAKSKLKHPVATNINEWLQAFTVYVSVIGKKQPHCIPVPGPYTGDQQ